MVYSREEVQTMRHMLDAYEARIRARASNNHVRMTFNVPRGFADRIYSEAAVRGWTPGQVAREYVMRGMTAEIEAALLTAVERGDAIA